MPLQTVSAAIEIAARHGTLVVLNPAPAAPIETALLHKVDFLVPNETEAGLLSGLAVDDLDSARRAGAALLTQGARQVLLTLGARGVWMLGRDGAELFPAPKVKAVDSTAAGDTFIGGFAVEIAAGADLPSAILAGQRAAALSVTRFGAQASIPYRREVDEFVWD